MPVSYTHLPYKANQNYDIGLRVLTPWYEGGTDDGTLRLLSGQGKEVLVVDVYKRQQYRCLYKKNGDGRVLRKS